MSLTQEQILNFIALWKERKCLWFANCEDYKNRNKRHDALMEIGVSFGITKAEVEAKIKSLLAQFNRERKKEKDSMVTGSGRENRYVSSWFAYQGMMFLADKNKPRKTRNTEVSILLLFHKRIIFNKGSHLVFIYYGFFHIIMML